MKQIKRLYEDYKSGKDKTRNIAALSYHYILLLLLKGSNAGAHYYCK